MLKQPVDAGQGVDALTSSAIKLVTELAIGNDVAATDISVLEAIRRDYALSLQMRVDVKWMWKSVRAAGQSHPSGSSAVSDEASAAEFVKAGCVALARSPETSAKLAAEGNKAPNVWFETYKDGARIGTASVQCHNHEVCETCRGSGAVPCGMTSETWSAKTYTPYACVTACSHCRQTGKQACRQCVGGTEHYNEDYYDQVTRTHQHRPVTRSCRSCNGSSFSSAECDMCHGSAVVACIRCGGRGTVRCNTCGGQGWFTRTATGWLTAGVSRSCSVAQDAPAQVATALRELDSVSLLKLCRAKPGNVTRQTGKVFVEIAADLPHVGLSVMFGALTSERFDFLGTACGILSMPPFLDRLLSARISAIITASKAGRSLEAISQAQGARVTREAVKAATGGNDNAQAISARWQGAITSAAVRDIVAALQSSYDGLGSTTIRRYWQIAAVPLLAWAIAVPLLSLGRAAELLIFRSDPGATGIPFVVTDGLAVLLPLSAIWLLSGRQARRGIRRLTGEVDARRTPAQGLWAGCTMAAASLALVTGWTLRLNTDWFTAKVPATGGAAALIRPVTLPQTNAPRLAFTAVPPPGAVRGLPATYKLQFALAQLGLLQGDPDGEEGPRMRDALGRFAQGLPSGWERFPLAGKGQQAIEAAMRGEFRLKLLADAGPAAPLSNFARSLITKDDEVRIQAMTDRAARSPGQPEIATSADGKRRFSVVASARQLSGCVFYELEVAKDGAAERTGTRTACHLGSSWTPLPDLPVTVDRLSDPRR